MHWQRNSSEAGVRLHLSLWRRSYLKFAGKGTGAYPGGGGHPGLQSLRGSKVNSKMNALNKKKHTLWSAVFKLLIQITGNSISNCNSFKP